MKEMAEEEGLSLFFGLLFFWEPASEEPEIYRFTCSGTMSVHTWKCMSKRVTDEFRFSGVILSI